MNQLAVLKCFKRIKGKQKCRYLNRAKLYGKNSGSLGENRTACPLEERVRGKRRGVWEWRSRQLSFTLSYNRKPWLYLGADETRDTKYSGGNPRMIYPCTKRPGGDRWGKYYGFEWIPALTTPHNSEMTPARRRIVCRGESNTPLSYTSLGRSAEGMST